MKKFNFYRNKKANVCFDKDIKLKLFVFYFSVITYFVVLHHHYLWDALLQDFHLPYFL